MRNRFGKVKKRAWRSRLFAAVGRRGQLFTTGLRPAASYGAAVVGVSDHQLLCLQKMAVSSAFPSPAARSRSAALLLLGDPTFPVAFAAILRWAKEVWRSGLGPAPAPQMDAPQLRRAWESVSARWPSSFAHARGPLGVAFLELRRAGWSWPEAFKLVRPDGAEILLTAWSPAALAAMLRSTSAEGHQRSLARRFGLPPAAEPSVEVCLAQVRSKERSPGARALLSTVVCDGVWPEARLRAAGYNTSGVCRLCGMAEDTL